MTPSEKYVAALCEKSFLPFWSFPNPIGKKGKELCDVLVVCNQYVIIISVKDISPSNHKDEMVNYDRWVKKAITNSVDQIYGAERYLESETDVLLKDRKTLVKLPPKESRQIFRIAIAFGSKSNYPLPHGDFDKGHVSVFDEHSTKIIIEELDTITDFTNYLVAKEKFMLDYNVHFSREADFLTFYINTVLEVDAPKGAMVAGMDGLWESYFISPEYVQWRLDLEQSLVWDKMIRDIYTYHITDNVSQQRREDLERIVRFINLEPRINRIELGSVLNNAIESKVKARMLRPLEDANHTYVILPITTDNWNTRETELQMRCVVARKENPTTEKIIGVAVGKNPDGDKWFDLCLVDVKTLDEDFIEMASKIQEEFGYFTNPKISNSKDFRK